MTARPTRAGRSRIGVQVHRKGPAAATPLYRQILEQLREQIRSGTLQPGDRLPSTRDLARELHVSRNTVEGALAGLVAEGLAVRRVGSGTRVASREGA